MKGAVGTVVRDIGLILMAVFVFVAVVAMLWVNPKGTKSEQKELIRLQGLVVVAIEWPSQVNVDVDLWVKAPQTMPVGYSNKGNVDCDLLRDDRGTIADPGTGNFEMTTCRVLDPKGEYVANVHYYGGNVIPVTVTYTINIKKDGKLIPVTEGQVILETYSQEITLARFRVGEDGLPLRDTLNNFPRSLITKRQSPIGGGR